MNILLCGLQGSGKTTFGKRLSTKLNCPFVDTDQLIESAYKSLTGKELSCHQIYKQEGKDYFRALEQREVTGLKPQKQTVIALGGGTLENPESLNHVIQLGVLIYLEAPLEILWERILLKGIPAHLDPLDPKTDFYHLAKRRAPLYQQAAHLILETTYTKYQK